MRALIVMTVGAFVGAASSAFAQPATVVLTHGFSVDAKGAWVQGMASAIIARAGGTGSVYRYTGASGAWTHVPAAGGDGTLEPIVCIFNWVPESDAVSAGPNWNYAQAAGDALYAALRDPTYALGSTGPSDLVTERTVQFIGHSRGACVISEAIRRLALAGVAVEQMTAHDPHPVNGTLDAPYNFNWGDPVPQKWSNVAFGDNYWRADGGGIFNGLDFDGMPLTNCFNVQLSESALNCCAYSFAHSDVHLWYHGTIDLAPAPCDGEQCINATMRQTWWPPPQGFAQHGFFYSALGGGAAQRPSQPPGIDPPADSAPFIYNGGFEQGSYAGWTYHGGSVGGTVGNVNNDWVLTLEPGQVAGHNRFYLPLGAAEVVFAYEVITPSVAGSVLHIALIDDGDDIPWELPSLDVSQPQSWVETAVAIGPSVPRSRTYTLLFTNGADPVSAGIVRLDDVAITQAPPGIPGDINGDGCVDVNDLLLVVGNWGATGANVADVNGDGIVDVNDLLLVVGAWGPCP